MVAAQVGEDARTIRSTKLSLIGSRENQRR
jgi:hypothetical protein